MKNMIIGNDGERKMIDEEGRQEGSGKDEDADKEGRREDCHNFSGVNDDVDIIHSIFVTYIKFILSVNLPNKCSLLMIVLHFIIYQLKAYLTIYTYCSNRGIISVFDHNKRFISCVNHTKDKTLSLMY